jgi:hypothetical protein
VVLGASNALGDSFISFVNEDSYAIVGTIRLDGTDPNATDPDDPLHTKITAVGGAIEQCQYNQRDGKFYLSIPSIDSANGAVLRISAKAPFKVEKVFKINAAATGCNGPAGLTIGPDHQMLVGCNQKSTGFSVIIDDRTGAVIQYVQTTWGVDEVWYDSGSNHYYLAQSCTPTSKPLVTCAGVTVMNVEDAGHGKAVPSPDNPPAATAPQSKNPAADPERNYVYLPVLGGKGTICSTTPDVNGNKSGSDSQGCIAIYSAPLDGDDRGRGDEQRRARK